MSVATFIPQVWEASLMRNFYEHSIVNLITTRPTKIEGNKIIFNRVSNIQISDYTGTVTYPTLDTSKVELPLDIKKQFSFQVDDVDAAQAAGDLIGPHMEEAACRLQETMDKIVLDEAISNSDKAVIKNAGENIYDVIVHCNMALNKRKVPKSNRVAVINAEALENLQLDARFTEHYQILDNGLIEGAKINGVQLIFSEELNEGKEAALVLHKSAIGFGTQYEKTEALRLESAFADGIRGLQVAGCKTLRPESIAFYAKAE